MAPVALRVRRILQATVLVTLHAWATSGTKDIPEAGGTCLLELRRDRSRLPGMARKPDTGEVQGCSDLVNHGSFSTVDIDVGTPAQRFSVVADTGSNTLIVPSCICQKEGYCRKEDHCFTGTNRSSSFHIVTNGVRPETLLLSFGSGMIEGIVAQDAVSVGHVKTFMEGGLVLMTSKALDFNTKFEGILGLGTPKRAESKKQPSQQVDPGTASGSIQDIISGLKAGGLDMDQVMRKIRDIMGGGATGDVMRKVMTQNITDRAARHIVLKKPDADVSQGVQSQGEPPSFLEQAGIRRFAICFNEGTTGVLRLGMPQEVQAELAHASIGTMHWGLDFRGISVGAGAGGTTSRLQFCSPKDMVEGQQTPCGAIPDSGTTLISGPKHQVLTLLDSVCEAWPRCMKNHTVMLKAAEKAKAAATETYGFDPFTITPWNKSDVVQALLEDCESWMDASGGLEELPSLHFHVGGNGSTSQVLKLPPRSWVFSLKVRPNKTMPKFWQSHKLATLEAASAWQAASKFPIGSGNEEDSNTPDQNPSGTRTVCGPAFSGLEYYTELNGPIWILGTSFFYEFNIGYDLYAEPPTVSFTSVDRAPCGSCDKPAGFIATAAEHSLGREAAETEAARLRWPRGLGGPVRRPNYDMSQPL